MLLSLSAHIEIKAGASTAPAAVTPELVDGVYHVDTVAKLLWISESVSAGNMTVNVMLTADIDLSGIENWTPIGKGSAPYKGTFDGGGHTISGMTVLNNVVNAQFQGMFAYLSDAAVRNLTLSDISVSARGNNIGGLAGSAHSSFIENVSVSGAVSGTGSSSTAVGGLVGTAENCTITLCNNNAAVSGGFTVGGLVGAYKYANNITCCVNSGTVTSTLEQAGLSSERMFESATGGLIGYMELVTSNRLQQMKYSAGYVNYCFNKGVVSGVNIYIGGIVGAFSYYGAKLFNNYNTGSVKSNRTGASGFAGGLIGTYPHINSIYTDIQYNYNAGTVSAVSPNTVAGSLYGRLTGQSQVENNFWLKGSADHGVGLLPEGVQDGIVIPFTDGADITEAIRGGAWGELINTFVTDKDGINNGYPVLAWQICGFARNESGELIVAHDDIEIEIAKPSCSAGGYTGHTCKSCGYFYKTELTAALSHTYGEGVIYEDASCYAEGSVVFICLVCGAEKTEPIARIPHTYNDGVVTDPTCVEQGYTTHTCMADGCGASYKDEITAPLGHDYEQDTLIEPTCEGWGYITYICTAEGCGSSKNEMTAPLGHDYESETIPPTCVDAGTIIYTCIICEHVARERLPALGHDFVDGVCTRDDCETVDNEYLFELTLQITPAAAAEIARVTVTDAQGNAVFSDAETGRYTLDPNAIYSYVISAMHFQTTSGQINGIGTDWILDEENSPGDVNDPDGEGDADGSDDTDDEDVPGDEENEEQQPIKIKHYTMVIPILPNQNTVSFVGSLATVTVDGREVAEVGVDYETDLEFAVEPAEGRWVSDIKAVVDAAIICDNTWTGAVSVGFGGGTGTEQDPYLIRTGAQMAYLAQEVNRGITFSGVHIKLTANIDMNGLEWTPIGTVSLRFMGTLDGDGYTICNLYSRKNGLFDYASGAVIKNLGLSSCSISSSDGAAGLVYSMTGGLVENCWVTGTIVTNGSGSGGLAGLAEAGVVIRDCWNGADITGRENMNYPAGIGGIVGFASGGSLITGCRNVGSVTGTNAIGRIGGIVGYINAGKVVNCCNSGAVSANGGFPGASTETQISGLHGAGGIAGVAASNFGADETIITGSYNCGTVYAEVARVGGIVGNLCSFSGTAYVEVSSCYNTGDVIMLNNGYVAGGIVGRVKGIVAYSMRIVNSYNTGSVSGGDTGAIAGYLNLATVRNCYSTEGSAAGTSFSSVNSEVDFVEFMSMEQMQSDDFVALLGTQEGFIDDVLWKNNGLPILSWQLERSDVIGEFREIPLIYDEERGMYIIESVLQPITVRIETRSISPIKRISFSIQPASYIMNNYNIAVFDANSVQIAPIAGSINSFSLNKGETYTYIVEAEGFHTDRGTLEVRENSSFLISVNMREIMTSGFVTFEFNRHNADVYNSTNDKQLTGSTRVEYGAGLGFYILTNGGYEIADMRISNADKVSDIWDGVSSDTEWYTDTLSEFTITTAAQLAGVSELVMYDVTSFRGMRLYLDADLDMTAGNFIPIGHEVNYITRNGSRAFQGSFNGQGHTITVDMSQQVNNTVALFGYVIDATIENVTVAGSVQSFNYCAGVVHTAYNSTIKGCINLANVTSTHSNSGAAGIACYVTGAVLNCYNGGAITGGLGVSGIVCSTSDLTIKGCHNAGIIRSTWVGNTTGAAGILASCTINSPLTIDSCGNSGSVYSAAAVAGGVVAQLMSNRYAIVTNCYNTGRVSCTMSGSSALYLDAYVGGIVGRAHGSMTLQNCYNTGMVTSSTAGAVGAVAGGINPADYLTYYSNNYWLEGSHSKPFSNVSGNIVSYSDRNFKQVGSAELSDMAGTLGYANWRDDSIKSNDGYPVLRDVPDTTSDARLIEHYYTADYGEYELSSVTRDTKIYGTLALPLESLTLGKSNLTLSLHDTYPLEHTKQGADAELWSISWSSSDTSVAAVTSAGLIIAVGGGTAVISAKAGKMTAVCTVAVETSIYAVTLGEGLQGDDSATQGLDYNGMIIDFIPDDNSHRYTVTCTIDGQSRTLSVSATGGFTIPGEQITGDITLSLEMVSIKSGIFAYADYITGYTLVIVRGEGKEGDDDGNKSESGNGGGADSDSNNGGSGDEGSNGSGNDVIYRPEGYLFDGNMMYYVEAYGAYAYLTRGRLTDAEAAERVLPLTVAETELKADARAAAEADAGSETGAGRGTETATSASTDAASNATTNAAAKTSRAAAAVIGAEYNVNMDRNGKVDISDVIAIIGCYLMEYDVGIYMEVYLRADVTADYAIDVLDVLRVMDNLD